MSDPVAPLITDTVAQMLSLMNTNFMNVKNTQGKQLTDDEETLHNNVITLLNSYLELKNLKIRQEILQVNKSIKESNAAALASRQSEEHKDG